MPLRILADLALPADAMEALRAGTRAHTLLLPARPAASVLAQGEPDPQLATADVVFGQPDAPALLASNSVRWAHISSAGITRYDNEGFRASARAKGMMLTNSSSVYDEACAVHGLSFLLAQARQELLAQELDLTRLQATLHRLGGMHLTLHRIARPTPFAFPLMVERLREKLSSESMTDRIARMVAQLERAATPAEPRPTRARARPTRA